MSSRRLVLAVVAACLFALPASGALSVSVASAQTDLCLEDGCGGEGVWGAKHHAIWYAENAAGHRSESVHYEYCKNENTNQKGVTQWTCGGFYGGNGPWHWRVHMGPFGELIGTLEVFT